MIIQIYKLEYFNKQMSCCPYCNYSLVDSSEDIISKHKEQCRRIYKNHTYLCNFCNTIIFKSNWTLFQRKYEFFSRRRKAYMYWLFAT